MTRRIRRKISAGEPRAHRRRLRTRYHRPRQPFLPEPPSAPPAEPMAYRHLRSAPEHSLVPAVQPPSSLHPQRIPHLGHLLLLILLIMPHRASRHRRWSWRVALHHISSASPRSERPSPTSITPSAAKLSLPLHLRHLRCSSFPSSGTRSLRRPAMERRNRLPLRKRLFSAARLFAASSLSSTAF